MRPKRFVGRLQSAPSTHPTDENSSDLSLKSAYKKPLQTLSKIRKHKNLWWFLLAYWFYIDGLATIIRMAVDFGLSIGLPSNSLIVALLIVQFVGFPATIVFGKIARCTVPQPFHIQPTYSKRKQW